jgi:hypothetical protein
MPQGLEGTTPPLADNHSEPEFDNSQVEVDVYDDDGDCEDDFVNG